MTFVNTRLISTPNIMISSQVHANTVNFQINFAQKKKKKKKRNEVTNLSFYLQSFHQISSLLIFSLFQDTDESLFVCLPVHNGVCYR